MSFKEKWLEAVDKKGSVLCAGLDPAIFEMGRGEKGLPAGQNKLEWAIKYVEAVAPYCAAVKPNIQYWKGAGDAEILEEITEYAHTLGMVVIRDDKLADIGSTNDAGIFYVAQSGADAVTFSPFAGNMEEATKQGKKHGIGVIAMCLMSNPDYKDEKNKLTVLEYSQSNRTQPPKPFDTRHGGTEKVTLGLSLLSNFAVKQYAKLAADAKKYGLDGIVIGAPSEKNHITEQEIKTARAYAGDEMLILLPGLGAQGGEAEMLFKHFAPDHVIANVGRDLMFPKGSNSTPEEQAARAKQYFDMMNKLRQ